MTAGTLAIVILVSTIFGAITFVAGFFLRGSYDRNWSEEAVSRKKFEAMVIRIKKFVEGLTNDEDPNAFGYRLHQMTQILGEEIEDSRDALSFNGSRKQIRAAVEEAAAEMQAVVEEAVELQEVYQKNYQVAVDMKLAPEQVPPVVLSFNQAVREAQNMLKLLQEWQPEKSKNAVIEE